MESGTPVTDSSVSTVATAPTNSSTTTSDDLITYGESTRDITTTVGQSFVLSLPANITTPYRWVLDSTVDPNAIELVKNEYTEASTSTCRGCVGVGGRRLLTFRIKRAGTFVLSLSYQSITDPKEAPESRFQATVLAK
jgi:inhibitor of cysteine peptidase